MGSWISPRQRQIVMMLEEVAFTLDPLAQPVANVEKAVKRGDMSGI
jgi:hypothetical protein